MRYINRELSWLAFNQRVLYEALDTERSLSQRLRFLSIFSNNLDEFFMIRVGAIDDQIYAGYSKRDPSGLRPTETMQEIRGQVRRLIALQSEIALGIFNEDLPAVGVRLLSWEALTQKERSYLEHYFVEEVFPTLTPMAVDFSRPFPLVLNKSLNVIARLLGEPKRYITMQLPGFFPRLVRTSRDGSGYVWLEDLVEQFLQLLLEGYKVSAASIYRITRNGDITIEDEGAEDLLQVIEASLRQRKWGDVLRLEIPKRCDEDLVSFLCEQFEIEREDIDWISGPLDLTCCNDLAELVDAEAEDSDSFSPIPVMAEGADIFERIREGDLLLHHPYHAFDPVVDFIETAARDPEVLAIKQVLYRVGGNSPIVKALQVAADSGKQVTVLLELKARFDEENNIQWAKLLEKNGCHVIYGIEGKKTHAKITLVVRREPEGIRRYVHLSSGNYNDKTARLYTDVGLFTCHEQIAQDASKFFNILSGYVNQTAMTHLVAAPEHLKPRLLELIAAEASYAASGRPAKIMAKVNALVDGDIIEALYQASQAGVVIQLIVRGVCCLVPQKKGLSERIWVKSIIDDYLEHSRLFYFHQAGDVQVYLSSADWMPRNLERRIELMVPVLSSTLKYHLIEVLDRYWQVQKKAHELLPTGHYLCCMALQETTSCQRQLEELYLTLSGNLN